MQLKVTAQRPGESDDEWKIRNAWALRANVKAGDLAAGTRLRGFKPTTQIDLNNDKDVTFWSGWGHKAAQEAQARTSPWQRPAPEMRDPARYPEPWKLGIAPPPVAPVAIPSPAAATLSNRWQPLVEERVMIPPDVRNAPIFAIPTPRTVHLVDLVEQQAQFDPFSHADMSLSKTLQAIGSQGATKHHTLPMEAKQVATHLKRGAELVVKNGRWVVQAGKHVLGPVGYAGAAYDAYQFIMWANEHREQFKGTVIPKGRYEFSSNQYLFKWPDGSVTTAPKNWGLFD